MRTGIPNRNYFSIIPVTEWLRFCSYLKSNLITASKLLVIAALLLTITGLAHAHTYEAESAEMSDAYIENIEIGYFGSGYAWCRHRGSLRWNITTTQDGVYELVFRYALRRGKHNLNVYVDNELAQYKQTFTNTGSWSTWGESRLRVFLSAGTHTVKLYNRWNSRLFVDSLTVLPLSMAQPGVAVGDNLLYEAEEALLNRVKIKNKKPGFTGTGYIKYRKFASADFAIETALPGEYDFKFRYMQHKKRWWLAIFVDGILDQVVRPLKTVNNSWSEFTLNRSYTF
ncbi:MAG TPA: carbohydrate-binding protein, partial [Chromatiales bacterium]|nr:carbohydrate-binding protein [Chromatiales bacterium]